MSAQQLYKIGSVSRLTGIPAVTLRMWERRHQVVEPQRTDGGGRRYSQSDLERLKLIKQAVDAGFSISTLAPLDDAAIRERLEQRDGGKVRQTPGGPLAVCVVGREAFFAPGGSDASDQRIECARAGHLNALPEVLNDSEQTVDALVVETELVTPEFLRELCQAQRLVGATVTVVVYQFSTRAHLNLLDNPRCAAMQAPAGDDAILAVCRDMLGAARGATPVADELGGAIFAEIPARRFDPEVLRQLAQRSAAVKCECPEHLATLVERLSAFEAYSAHCESENKEDAAVHMMLHAVSANVRRSLEDALQTVIEHEGISLPNAD